MLNGASIRIIEIHVVLDNYATHKHEKASRARLKPEIRGSTSTSSALAGVLRQYRGTGTSVYVDERQAQTVWGVNSVSQLIHAINTYLDHRNEDPTPFVWTKSAQEILTKIHRGLKTLEALH